MIDGNASNAASDVVITTSTGTALTDANFSVITIDPPALTLAGAAGMFALEKSTPGFTSYWMALWWTATRVITAGNEFYPMTPEGRGLGFLISVFGFSIFGYFTATFATYFIGRDAEEKDAPLAGSKEIRELKAEMIALRKIIESQK